MLLVWLITLIRGRKIANDATKCPSMWTENNIHDVFLRATEKDKT